MGSAGVDTRARSSSCRVSHNSFTDWQFTRYAQSTLALRNVVVVVVALAGFSENKKLGRVFAAR